MGSLAKELREMIEISDEALMDCMHCGNPDMTYSKLHPIVTCVDNQRSMTCDPIVEQLYAQMMGWA